MGQIIPAASVLLTRHPGSQEVYLVERSLNLRFMGGFTAFPGGKFADSDAALVRVGEGLTPTHVAAVRELFEETGVLIARRSDGTFPTASDELAQRRRLLLHEEDGFAALLHDLGLSLHASDFHFAGRFVTPPFSPMRFDTTFFAMFLPPGQSAEVWAGELTAGRWQSAADALHDWRNAGVLLSPPTVSILQAIEGRPVTDAGEQLRPHLQALEEDRLPPIWFSPDVLLLPLDCQGLPPTTHTNTFLVGSGPRYLIDPGPAEPQEQERLIDALGDRRPDAIVLTHHHPDHIGAAVTCARRFAAPILAHPEAVRWLSGKVSVDRTIEDGETLDLGPAPHGRGRWGMTAILTPGHAPGHLAFYEPDYRLLFAGDVVSTLSSMIIHPDEGGDLAVYLNSLRRLQQYPARLLLPAHGGASARPGHVLNEALAHRQVRETQLLETLATQANDTAALALALYRGSPPPVLRLAEVQIRAGLLKLLSEGKVEYADGLWRLRK